MNSFFEGFPRVVLRELRRFREKPMLIIFGVFLPLFLQLFMFFIFIDGVPRDLPVAVCDLDGTPLSRELERKIDSTPSTCVRYHIADIETGRQMINRKEVYALLVIPENFESEVLRGLSPAVVNYYNNLYLLPGTLVYKDVRDVVSAVSTDIKVKNMMRAGMMEARARELATPVSIISHRLFNPYTNYQYYLSGGFMPTVFQMLIIITCIMTMGFELKEGSAGEWLEAAGGNTVAALSGKLFPYTVSFLLIGIFMVTLLLRYAQVPVHGETFYIFAALFLLILACQSVAVFFTGVLASLRLSLSAGSGYTAIAFTYTGLTFPAMGMPLCVRFIGEFIPLTYYLRIFISQSMRGAPASTLIHPFTFLFLFLALPFFVIPRWHDLLRKEQFWGRI